MGRLTDRIRPFTIEYSQRLALDKAKMVNTLENSLSRGNRSVEIPFDTFTRSIPRRGAYFEIDQGHVWGVSAAFHALICQGAWSL